MPFLNSCDPSSLLLGLIIGLLIGWFINKKSLFFSKAHLSEEQEHGEYCKMPNTDCIYPIKPPDSAYFNGLVVSYLIYKNPSFPGHITYEGSDADKVHETVVEVTPSGQQIVHNNVLKIINVDTSKLTATEDIITYRVNNSVLDQRVDEWIIDYQKKTVSYFMVVNTDGSIPPNTFIRDEKVIKLPTILEKKLGAYYKTSTP